MYEGLLKTPRMRRSPAGRAPSANSGSEISTLIGEIRKLESRVRSWRENLDLRNRGRGGLTCGFMKMMSNRWSRNGVPLSHSRPLPTDSAEYGRDFAARFALEAFPDEAREETPRVRSSCRRSPECELRRDRGNGISIRRLRASCCAQASATAIMKADGSPW